MSYRVGNSLWNGDKFRELLERRGISQRQFGFILGVTSQTVCKWCRKNNRLDAVEPTFSHLHLICKYLDVDYHYFLTDKPRAHPISPVCQAKDMLELVDIESIACKERTKRVVLYKGKIYAICSTHADSLKHLFGGIKRLDLHL